MLNKVKQGLGYRDVIYNIKSNKFFEFVDGDNYKEIDISVAASATFSGPTSHRPAAPSTGDLFWDTSLAQLFVWTSSEWKALELSTSAAASRSVVAVDSANNLEAARIALQTAIDNAIAERNAAIAAGDTSTLISANAYTDTKVSEVLGGSPDLLNTLNELAEAIGDDADFITTINASIAAVQADVDANEATALAARNTIQDNVDAIQVNVDANEATALAARNAIQADVDANETAATTAIADGDAATLASANAYTDTAITNLTNGADAALDTLKEIGDALAAGDQSVTDALTTSITTESTTRAAADTALSDRLDVLEADPTTQTLLDAEGVARAAAIEAEATARVAADANETAERVAAISAEETARIAGDASETAARSAAITAEETARIAADAVTLTSSNSYTDTQVSSGDAAVTNAMTALVTTETAARGAADSALSARIDVLEADPTTATALAAAITTVQADVDQNEADSDAAISAEEARALAAETSITTSLTALVTAEEARALAAEAVLTAAITTEETRATAAEASITATHTADEAARNQLNLHAGLAFGQLYVGDLVVA